jgi:hypothetical protein
VSVPVNRRVSKKNCQTVASLRKKQQLNLSRM